MTYKDNSIYIVPNDIKKDLLLDLSKEKELKNIKFFSLKEFLMSMMKRLLKMKNNMVMTLRSIQKKNCTLL